jgi:hypothetical protein
MRAMKRWFTRTLLFLVEAAVFTGAVHAAEICAFVGNWDGHRLHGVRVSAVSLVTNKRYEARSDSQGRVCFSDIPEGPYAVEAGTGGVGYLNVRYYPVRVGTERTMELTFRLPAGENSEGPMIVNEAFLSGTLRVDDKPIEWANMCLTKRDSLGIPICVRANDLGEYALDVAPGLYDVEICTENKLVYKSVLDVPSAGYYRERISVKPPGKLGPGCQK